MNNGGSVLQWAHQRNYTVTWLAEQLGYSRQRLSDALHQNDISPALSKVLFEQFTLRVIPTYKVVEHPNGKTRRMGKQHHQRAVGKRGRKPGSGHGVRPSKLDPHTQEIMQLLQGGMTQREIARRYGTTPSNLHDWLKKRGLI
ncbi:MAG: hypothetical protein ETSY1_43230 [Candidatus Entotheonella factor]|uniref:Resolvase HTH domain-containing protein n=1 Tax=Entotheonella factor TaxID=1429438 RepID=W4L4C8_ENTF1|nr:MAG: hypothetical protein ETSY1_43230 [Candidatus Entotheonella factor]